MVDGVYPEGSRGRAGEGDDFRGFLCGGAEAQPGARADHGGDLRNPGRDDRGSVDEGNPLSRQADRRARQGEGDGEDFAGVGAANDKWRTSSSSPERISEEHKSELQSPMRLPYAVFRLQ